MKSLKILITAAFIVVALGTNVYAQKAGKIGYVDLSRLFDEYYVTKDYDKELEGKHSSFETERNSKIEKIRESQGKLGLLKEDEKEKLEAEIEKMKADLLEYDGQKKQDLTKERNDKIREILLEIEKQVSAYAEKEGFSVILNDRVLIFGSQTLNVTEDILKNLNSAAPESK